MVLWARQSYPATSKTTFISFCLFFKNFKHGTFIKKKKEKNHLKHSHCISPPQKKKKNKKMMFAKATSLSATFCTLRFYVWKRKPSRHFSSEPLTYIRKKKGKLYQAGVKSESKTKAPYFKRLDFSASEIEKRWKRKILRG